MSPSEAKKPQLMRALVGAGFRVLKAETRAAYFLVLAERNDVLGVRARYAIALVGQRLSGGTVSTLATWSKREGASLVVLGAVAERPPDVSVLTFDQFLDRLGGPIFSLLPLEPEYKERLLKLGHNELPDGLTGKADDLFEQYVHAGLQFTFRSRVVRYGQERRGEAVADGLAMAAGAPLLLYDAKAAGGGYEMSKDEERKFEDYVREFHEHYERTFGRLTAIVVISGSFSDGEEALQRRFRQVLSATQVPLAFMDAKTMGEIVAMMVKEPLYRLTVDWRLVFSEAVVRSSSVESEMKARRRDGLTGGTS